MRKLIFSLIVIFLMSVTAQANDNNVHKLRVDKVSMDNYAFTNGVTVTSDSISTKGNTGFAVLVVDFDALEGDLDIDMEVSLDGVDFFDPYTTDGTTLTIADSVVDTLTADRWIILTARLANYIRFEFEPDSDCTSDSVKFMYQEDF